MGLNEKFFASSSCNPSATGLQLFLDASDTSSYSGTGSTWSDLSGNNNDFTGINMDGTDWNSDGYFSFNGTNEHFDGAGFTPSLTDVQTVSYWIRNPTVSNHEMVMTIGQTGISNVYSWINFAYNNTGEINASYGTTNGDISNKTTANSAFTGNTWYHVCFLVFPANRGTSNQCFKIYIDGSEVAVTNATTAGTLPTVQGYPIIGKYSAQNQLRFSGDLAKFRIYDRRLTEPEIEVLYCAGR